MSKSIVKSSRNGHVPETISKKQNLQVYHQTRLPQVREVNLPAVKEENHLVISSYKDLDQPAKDFAKLQQRNLIIAFVVFVGLGAGIVMGHHFDGSRSVASNGVPIDGSQNIPSGAVTISNTHYQFDKSCYTGNDGELVCTTRTSNKRQY